MSFKAAYRIRTGSHRFVPSITWARDNRDGAAIANDGFAGDAAGHVVVPGQEIQSG
jgi:hypothetical protein